MSLLAFVTETLLVISLPPDWNVTVGVWICSLAVNDNVISLPTFANWLLLVLFDAIVTLDNVGTVLSKVTEPVPLSTSIPSLPAISENSIL